MEEGSEGCSPSRSVRVAIETRAGRGCPAPSSARPSLALSLLSAGSVSPSPDTMPHARKTLRHFGDVDDTLERHSGVRDRSEYLRGLMPRYPAAGFSGAPFSFQAPGKTMTRVSDLI